MASALKIEKLQKSFGKNQAVCGIDLEVQPGEIFGLLGPNGAGKSTTINMIAGVTKIGSGKISVFGHDVVSDFYQSRRRTGVMHQEIVIDNFFTIDNFLRLYSGFYGATDDPKWRDYLIDRLALRPHIHKSMRQLSGGMKRRFMVAKALIHRPSLIILDEPTAGVDVELRQQLWSFVRELNQSGGTVLLTTHYLEEAEEMCGRVAIMNHGEIVACDSTRNILDNFKERCLTLHFESAQTDMPSPLTAFKHQVLDGGKTVKFWFDGESVRPRDILHAIHETDLRIHEIETERPSLEEAFINLTRTHN